jgi:hypothetical protein
MDSPDMSAAGERRATRRRLIIFERRPDRTVDDFWCTPSSSARPYETEDKRPCSAPSSPAGKRRRETADDACGRPPKAAKRVRLHNEASSPRTDIDDEADEHAVPLPRSTTGTAHAHAPDREDGTSEFSGASRAPSVRTIVRSDSVRTCAAMSLAQLTEGTGAGPRRRGPAARAGRHRSRSSSSSSSSATRTTGRPRGRPRKGQQASSPINREAFGAGGGPADPNTQTIFAIYGLGERADDSDPAGADETAWQSPEDVALPVALAYPRSLPAGDASRIRACMRCRTCTFDCTYQDACIGLTGALGARSARDARRSGPPRDSGNSDAEPDREEEEAEDEDEEEDAVEFEPLDPAVLEARPIRVEGYACPLHGDRHAYCAPCLMHLLGLDEDETGPAHLPPWPARCPGVVRRWTDPARPSPDGRAVAAPVQPGPERLVRCDFVLGKRYVGALLRRCPSEAIAAGLPNTFGRMMMLARMLPDNGGQGHVPGSDDPRFLDANASAEGEEARMRHLAVRMTRAVALRSVERAQSAEYAERALAARPDCWKAVCPGSREHVRFMNRRAAIPDVCVDCTEPGCGKAYCTGCGGTIDTRAPEGWSDRGGGSGSSDPSRHGEEEEEEDRNDRFIRDQIHKHMATCYKWIHTPWITNDDVFLTTTLVSDDLALALERSVESDAASEHGARDGVARSRARAPSSPSSPSTEDDAIPREGPNVYEVLIEAGRQTPLGGAGLLRYAIAARIAECVARAVDYGGTQRCPTCRRRVNMDTALAGRREAYERQIAACAAVGDIKRAARMRYELELTYSTAVDWCACGVAWCYLCERVLPGSRMQRDVLEECVSLAERALRTGRRGAGRSLRADADQQIAPLLACVRLGRGADAAATPPPPPAMLPARPPDASGADLQAAWAAEWERSRAYWHEDPRCGPWQHTAGWNAAALSLEDRDPLRAPLWPACPPSMADLGSLGTPLFCQGNARHNVSAFHALKRHRLLAEVGARINRAPLIGPDILERVRGFLLSASPMAWEALCAACPLRALSREEPAHLDFVLHGRAGDVTADRATDDAELRAFPHEHHPDHFSALGAVPVSSEPPPHLLRILGSPDQPPLPVMPPMSWSVCP